MEAEAFIYESLRVREMLSQNTTFQFDISTSSEALPSDFLDPIQFHPHTWDHELPYYHEASFLAPRDEDGALYTDEPSAWTIIGTTAYVDVLCEANFAGVLLYYALPTALSSSNETNFLTTRYPSLLRYACMAKAYEHMKDGARAKEYLALAMGAIGSAMATNDMFRRSQHVVA